VGHIPEGGKEEVSHSDSKIHASNGKKERIPSRLPLTGEKEGEEVQTAKNEKRNIRPFIRGAGEGEKKRKTSSCISNPPMGQEGEEKKSKGRFGGERGETSEQGSRIVYVQGEEMRLESPHCIA